MIRPSLLVKTGSQLFLPALLACMILFSASVSQAQLLISAQSVAATAGDTGASLDILLTNSSPGAVSIGAFAFEITVGSSDITFTDITTGTTTAPYIFGGFSLFGPNIGTAVTGQDFLASDLFSIPAGGATIGAGVTVGLGHLIFNVAATANGPYPVTILPFPNTSLSDADGNNVEVSGIQGGSIRVTGSSSQVPEPGSIALFGGLAIPAAILLRRRRA